METRKENLLGTQPINKLLISMSLPIMLSMLFQALYNIVDSVFVARISDDALTAVSISFSPQNLMIAFGVGTSVGVNALLSRRLGEKRYDESNLVANNGMFLSIITSVFFTIFGFFFSRQFFEAFTNDINIVNLGFDYLSICCGFSIFNFVAIMGERIIQVTGTSIYYMISQMAGAITNMILDPIMIFGLFGCPKMGVKGAAIATVLGQVVSMCLILYFNYKHNNEVKLSFKSFKPNKKIILEIYQVGLPSIIMQGVGSIMVYGMNQILIKFSSIAVNVFGVYFKLQSFVFLPIIGMNNGLIPIIGFNYGARKKERIFAAIKLAMKIAFVIMALGLLVFNIFPAQMLVLLFEASDEMLFIGVPALKTISLSFIFASFSIVLSGTFQALGKGINSMIMSICRQLFVLLPSAYLLGKIFGLQSIWYSFLIAELVVNAIAALLYKRVYKSELKDL